MSSISSGRSRYENDLYYDGANDPYHDDPNDGDSAFELTGPEGSECAVQTLYEGKSKCTCCKVWVAECPDDVRAAAEDKLETKEKALVVRMSKNHGDDGSKPLIVHSIVVQNSSLRKTLAEVFDGYAGITPALGKLVFKAPFEPFHHRWSRFTDVLEQQNRDNPEEAAYTQLLYDVIDAELQESRREISDLLGNKVITYDFLWALLKPGTIFMRDSAGQQRFYLVGDSHYDSGSSCFRVSAMFVDSDGSHFGYSDESIAINSFNGTRQITDLPLFPAEFHPGTEEAKTKAVCRGRKFVGLKGVCYMAHSGIMTCNGKQNKRFHRDLYTSGRIIVDSEGYGQAAITEEGYRYGNAHNLSTLASWSIKPYINVHEDVHGGVGSYPEHPVRNYVDSSSEETHLQAKHTVTLTEEQLLLCVPTVRGYSLKLKEWGTFLVDDITPISFNDTAFPNLMLPPTYKDLILSSVEAHPGSRNTTATTTSSSTTHPTPHFDDLIEGKGLGVVLLLVGNPGTGKTLTAEAVADRVRRALYVLSVGELGQQAADVEPALRDALELAERWGAVLLFDECDVFLQERSGGGGAWDLERNGVVAVFLRLLEYYRGILFMTTNRGETIDRAFHSRIHLTLRYPDLGFEAKEHIWRHFTTLPAVGEGLSGEVYQELAALPLDGRQIKNTVRIATLVAARHKVPLGVEHIRTALQAIQVYRGSLMKGYDLSGIESPWYGH